MSEEIERMDRIRQKMLVVKSKVNGKCSACHGHIIGDKHIVEDNGVYQSFCSLCFDDHYVEATVRGEVLKFWVLPKELL